MPRLAWLTDLHLGFATEADLDALTTGIRAAEPKAVLISGDISEASTFAAHLTRIAEAVPVPVCFVLGNHDFYRSSIAQVRAQAVRLTQQNPQLVYLSAAGVIPLSKTTALVGHDGWGDGRTGDFLGSRVLLNDYLLIAELARMMPDSGRSSRVEFAPGFLRRPLLETLKRLGDEAADHFRAVLPAALEWAEHVVVVTHVPPFREACWHEGNISDDEWSPHFTCIAAGKALVEAMRQHPEKTMTVLCGHTHSGGFVRILDNLEVQTGPARYGHPAMQPLLNIN